jgi:hypothetical protein
MELNLGARAFDRRLPGIAGSPAGKTSAAGRNIPLSGAVAEMRPHVAGARAAVFVQGMDMDMASTGVRDGRSPLSRKGFSPLSRDPRCTIKRHRALVVIALAGQDRYAKRMKYPITAADVRSPLSYAQSAFLSLSNICRAGWLTCQ